MTAKYQAYVRDTDGRALPGKSVTVYLASTGALATLTNELGVAVSNPVTTRGDGQYEFYCESGRYNLNVNGEPLNDVLIAQPLFDPGQMAINSLAVAADVVSAETVTIGADKYEVEIVNTDSADTCLGGSFNQITGAITILKASYPHLSTTLGTLIRVENEIMRLTGTTSTTLTYTRAVSGTTIAAHVNTTAIYIGDGIAAGSTVAVGLVTTLTPTAFTAALVADINSVGTELVTAVLIAVGEIFIKSTKVGAFTIATTETLAGTGNAWAATAMYGGKAQALTNFSCQTRVPKALDVTLDHMQFQFNFTPVTVRVWVAVTATPGKAVAWDGAVTISGGLVTVDNSGSTDFTTAHTVTVIAVG